MLNTILHNKIVKNAFWLYVVQIANYIVPLIQIPFLLRALGVQEYGRFAFVYSFILYLVLFVDYGFSLSATREISVNRQNPRYLNVLILNIWLAKLLLSIIALLFLVLVVGLVPILRPQLLLLMVLFGVVLGNVLLPSWLYQGTESMAIPALLNLGARLAVLMGVLISVNNPQDTLIYSSLLGSSALISGFIGAVLAIRIYQISWIRPDFQSVLTQLRKSWPLFLSKAAVSFYTLGNAFILGILGTMEAVGYYSAAEKAVQAAAGLVSPLSQAIYPYFSRAVLNSKKQALLWARRAFWWMGGFGIILSGLLFFTAEYIVNIFFGPGFEESIRVIKVMSLLPFLINLSNLLGVQLMVPFGYDIEFSRIIIMAAVFNLLIALYFVSHWLAVGMGLAVLVSETIVTLSMFVFLWRKCINPMQKNRVDV